VSAPRWRVEFDRDAAKELRKLGEPARRTILRYLRERIATAADPRRFGKALAGEFAGLWRTGSATTGSSFRSRTIV
jgi:mRNA interferase RelE/StbE